MPPSTQALYFQLGMHADDDGFVGPKKIMRMIGATEDELKILIAKGFAIPFESGVVVTRHWRVNNLVRKDWYRPTIHTAEKAHIVCDKSGCYLFVSERAPSSLTQVGSKVGSNRVFSLEENAGDARQGAQNESTAESVGRLLRAKKII